MNPGERWRAALEARAIPQELIDAAPESPWGFPREVFEARGARVIDPAAGVSPTTDRATEATPEGGIVLDVGVGGGATSLPLATRAGTIIGVDGQPDMLEAFTSTATAAGVRAIAVEGRWPDVAPAVPVADVVMSGHTLYNAPDLEPFVLALHDHALQRVVLEATGRHPLGWMADLWRIFHGLDIPDEPRVELAIEVMGSIGIEPRRHDRPGGDDDPAGGGFTTRDAAVALVRTRLCLRPDDDAAIADALGSRLRLRNGRWSAGPHERTVVTLWWDRAA
ncbi:MAG TPA: class I SAM-dependent methyltransferase [Actinomycetota bacterium]